MEKIFYPFPPTSSAGTAKQKGRSQAVTGTSATDVAIGNVDSPYEPAVFICDVPFHIRFGGALTGGAPGAAVAGDFYWPANVPLERTIPAGITLLSVIREGSTSGVLYWYLPGT